MSTKKETKEKIMATVIGDLPLNIREAKTTDSAVVGRLQPNTEIEILKEGKLWCEVKGGYVMRKFLSL